MDNYAILYEDEDILVANKVAPLPVQPEKTKDPSLQDLLRAELAARPGSPDEPFLEAAHRIDRRASGAIVFAKTRRALETLSADFRERRIDKEYVACVEREPVPSAGRLENRLVWDKRSNVVRAFPVESAAEAAERKKPAELAVLEYSLASASERYWFLDIKLITGKHHQIRAQLSRAGFPIKGDIKYGARRTNSNGLIMLHARKLSLVQPRTRENLEIVAPFPASDALWAAYVPQDENLGAQ
ncbi:MAG TPA: RluA family pseudouridine synthase [Spirochaetia bacterium]|nr:RluA family pseudouridine synthase [Spirochaetia bacterium]